MNIISILVLILVAVLFFGFKKGNMIIISITVLVIIVGLSFKFTKGFVPLPIWIRHMVNLTIPPKDLYQPIVIDKFLFHEQGFSKSYFLKPKYLDIYEVGFLIDNDGIESTYKFDGKLKVEFYLKDNLLFDSVITSIDQAIYAKNDMSFYKQISLLKFNIPLEGKYINDISMKLTVLEPETTLKEYNNLIHLYVAVSSTP